MQKAPAAAARIAVLSTFIALAALFIAIALPSLAQAANRGGLTAYEYESPEPAPAEPTETQTGTQPGGGGRPDTGESRSGAPLQRPRDRAGRRSDRGQTGDRGGQQDPS